MYYFDNSSEVGGEWNPSIDCIFLDNSDSDGQYDIGETVLAGVAPLNNTVGTGGGCKNMSAWFRIKSFDASDGGVWDNANDAIIFEGIDNNTCYLDELNAITFNLTNDCNATNTDLSDLTLWMENDLSAGFQSSGSSDTLIGNASYSMDSNSWNISGINQDINLSETFYVAVNISASAVNYHTVKMEIPTLYDANTNGAYDYGDQGVFLAGTNDTGSISNLYNMTIDNFAPESSVDDISMYWQNSQPLSISASATDNVSGISNVTLFWYNSTDNLTWSGPWSFGIDSSSPYSWSFTFDNDSGHYRFYSIAVDNLDYIESFTVNDTMCGYETGYPTSSVNTISSYWQNSSPLVITASASDSFSGLSNVTLYWYNSTDNLTWSGPWSFGIDSSSPYSWSFTFDNGSSSHYRFYSIAINNASNIESAPAINDTMCFYNNTAPNMTSNPSPNNGTTGVSRTKDISWVGSDPDNDNLTYYVYFGTNSTPNINDLVSSNQNETTYDPGVLSYYTRYYWKIVTKDEHGVNTSGPIWNFRTVRKSSGGGGSLPNQKPVADANGPYNGIIGKTITLDGSGSYDSDGSIIDYSWTFGDGTSGSGKKPTHTYTSAGTYSISLTVTDNDGDTDIDYTSVSISDDSDNDGWNDDIEDSYGTDKNNSNDNPMDTDNDGKPDDDSPDGKYTGDTDDDNDGISDDIEELIGTDSKDETSYINIDIEDIENYLIDTDDDGEYDLFYDPESETEIPFEIDEDGNILIDYDNDGDWDYKFNIDTGELIDISEEDEEEETPGFGFLMILIVLGLIGIVVKIKRQKKR
jgi:chitodextrinase